MNYTIFNKSSEIMDEIDTELIDLIFFSPPYNTGTRYEDGKDNLPLKEYISLMKNVIKECSRVLKQTDT